MDPAALPAIPLLPTLIETYLARCAVEGKSPRTIHAYRESLARFQRCLREDGAPLDPDRLRPDHVVTYLTRFAARSPDTRHRYFREVRCFCNWLRTAGYTENDPFRGLRNVRLPRKIVPPLGTRRDRPPARLLRRLTRWWAAAIARSSSRCWTPASAAPRRSSLDLADCAPGGAPADSCGRARAARTASCPSPAAAPTRSPPIAPTAVLRPGPLFLAARYARLNAGVRLRPNGLKQLLRRLGRDAGIPKVHAHRFRHTFATWAIAHDARELDVQHLLGHSSPEMVRRYSATYGSAQAAERHAAFSPGDGMLVGPG